MIRHVPPVTLLSKWMDGHVAVGTDRLTPPYDDVLDVLKGFLLPIPVDDEWYTTEYPAIADYLVRTPTETPSSHFQKHGYFEGRKPFAPGWQNLRAPVPFSELKTRLRLFPARGRLQVDISRDDFIGIIKSLLAAVPVDEKWYRGAYADVEKAVGSGELASAADHYREWGYFDGRLPFKVAVDEKWYVSRYSHVRTGLKRGVAKSAADHFMRLGYKEGCRPTPP